MNKLSKVLLAITGAINLVFDLVLPILVCALWVKFWSMDGFMSGLFYGIGFVASAFRGIKMVALK